MDDVRGKRLTRSGECNVKHREDKDGCDISSLQYLPGGELLVCDTNNQSLKLVDKALHVNPPLKLRGRPRDIAVVGDKEAVVTMPDQRKLQFVTVGPQLGLTLGREVATERSCFGIACSKGKIYATCQSEGGVAQVLVLNKQGELQTRITNSKGVLPYYVAVDDQGSIYLSERNPHTVTCINSAGQTVYTYKDAGLKNPGQLLVDTNRYVYVCGSISDTVEVITDKGRKYKTLLTGDDGIATPWCLAYRNSDKTLALGQSCSNSIVFYRFR